MYSVLLLLAVYCVFFFFKQKTAYEMRISDWSSDVCSSDLLAKKTHRGLRGRIEKGFSAGAVGYGYRMIRRLTSEGELVRGEREIDPAEALIVARIFRAFAAGKRPLAIARDTHSDGLSGPAGKNWRGTLKRGDIHRGSGTHKHEHSGRSRHR